MHNYYKTLGDNFKYFKKSLLILLHSALANAVAYVVFRSTVAISIASIFTMVIWYLYIEQYFVVHYQYLRYKNFLYLIFLMAAFYVITAIPNWIVSGIIYLGVYILITFICQRKVITLAKDFLLKKE